MGSSSKPKPKPAPTPSGAPTERPRGSATEVEDLRLAIEGKLFSMIGRFPEVATRNDYYLAVAYAVRDRVLRNSVRTSKTYFKHASRTAVYLSAEFLIGPQLGKNLVNLGIYDQAAQALAELGKDLDELLDQEEEPGLGNGGLGRLAACYMDSMATLEIPAIGYGIRYEFGIFEQEIRDGWQVEKSDNWLRLGYPWEIPRPEIAFDVKLGGHTEPFTDERGQHVRAVDPGRGRWWARRTTPWSRATGSRPSTCCGSGRPRRATPSTSRRSTRATTTGPSTTRSPRRTSRRSSTRTTSRRPASSCASSSSTSSCRARCTT